VSVRSADPAEACFVGTRVFHDHRLELLGQADAFAMRLEATSIGPLTIGSLTYDTEVQIETQEYIDSCSRALGVPQPGPFLGPVPRPLRQPPVARASPRNPAHADRPKLSLAPSRQS
jgi:hypothetical protein